jgi:glycosyl hydrolase family 16
LITIWSTLPHSHPSLRKRGPAPPACPRASQARHPPGALDLRGHPARTHRQPPSPRGGTLRGNAEILPIRHPRAARVPESPSAPAGAARSASSRSSATRSRSGRTGAAAGSQPRLRNQSPPRPAPDAGVLRQPHEIDVSTGHRYAVDWQPGRVGFLVDDVLVKTVHQAPDYPMQLILGVFDFPGRAPAGQAEVPVPELVVRRVLARSGPAAV